ncbi:hypothetical protein GJ496_002857 [Pomphorhynchus laevis]|nr:hypothetical protein GJ496_002857 [Pomphorhynchus laevis]
MIALYCYLLQSPKINGLTYSINVKIDFLGYYQIEVPHQKFLKAATRSPFHASLFVISELKLVEALSTNAFIGQPIVRPVYVGRAGKGKLTSWVQSPSVNYEASVNNISAEFLEVSFTPRHKGKHNQKFFYNNIPVDSLQQIIHVNDLQKTAVNAQSYPLPNTDVLSNSMETKITVTSGLDSTVTKIFEPINLGIYCNLGKPDCEISRKLLDNLLSIKFETIDNYLFTNSYDIANFCYRLKVTIASRIKIPQHRIVSLYASKSHAGHLITMCLKENLYENGDFTISALLKKLRILIDSDDLFPNRDRNQKICTIRNSLNIDPVQKDVNHEVIPEGNGNYKLSFTPTEIGQYRIFISYREIAAEHCPLYIEAYDINAIKLISIPKEINVGVDSYFNIDYTLAGSVKAKIKIHQQEPDFDELVYSLTTDASGGLQTVKFVPAKVGLLKVDVTLNNEHIKGSPFNIIVGNNYTPKVSGDGLICGIVNQLCEFVVSSCGSDASLRVKIEGDNGVSPWAEILKCSNSTFIIRYLPDGVGYYRISIDLGDFSIRGSPFTVPVVNPKKVRLISDYFAYVNGMSVYMLAVNKTNIIEVTTENAGPGELSALIKSSKQKIPYEIIPISPVKQQISFMPVQVGPHEIQIFWSGFPIDNSKPIKAHVDTQIQSNDRIKVYGTIFCEAFVNTDNEFIIDATDSDKLAIPIVTVKHEESKNSELPVKIHQIEKNIFKCHFRPLMTGIHNMFIMWLGHSISQSPIAFKVYDSNSANFRYKASIIDYDKSHEGIVNKPISFYVEIISAKPGQLVTKCTDPNGVPLMTNIIKKSDNLCSVKIIPTSEGIHDFEALFDGSQIDGSPLKFQVKNKALLDPSKIKVTGPGIQDGFLENFDSSFECDTKEAGRGHLTVRIRGPKGAFRVNMQKCEENPRIIYCSYNPVEAGVYVISIQWADQEIPGSPYTVQICHADSSDIPTIAIT